MNGLIIHYEKLKEAISGVALSFDSLKKQLKLKEVSFRDLSGYYGTEIFSESHLSCNKNLFILGYFTKYLDQLKNVDFIISNEPWLSKTTTDICKITISQCPWKWIGEIMCGNNNTYDISLNNYARLNSNILVAPSKYMHNYLKELGFKSEIIPWGIDPNLFKPVKNKNLLKKQLNIPRNKTVGIAVIFGYRTEKQILKELVKDRNNIFWIITSIKKLWNIDYDNVLNIPVLPNNEMPKYYNASDFYINTSPAESFDRCTIEAMASDLPVVSMRTGILYDWNIKCGILIDKWELENFRTAIKQISDFVWHYQVKSPKGLKSGDSREEFLKKELTLEKMKERWVKFIERKVY